MQFNSYEFIFIFLPLTVIFYYLANKAAPLAGKLVMIASGLIFYSYGRTNVLIYLAMSILINYCFAMVIRRLGPEDKQIHQILALAVIVNVVPLLYFKYLGFVITNSNTFADLKNSRPEIMLPLGISFYTFQQIAYIVAVEKGSLENISLIDYLAYILYFPKILMGPITDPADYISQLNQAQRKKADLNNIATGVKLFSLGLIKKMMLADTFAAAVSWTYENIDAASSMDCLLLMLFYTFEIYFDFSGYSDMAVGISSMLNIDLPINFDSPYKAVSIRDFWKRWHISLTRFLTKYVYIPLGGSRKGRAFTYLNIMIVFFVSGLWHGDNWTFILWGLLHGLCVCFDKRFENRESRVPKLLRWLCTFSIVNVLWLLFSAQSVGQWKGILARVLQMKSTTLSEGMIAVFDQPELRLIRRLFRLNHIAERVPAINMFIFIIAACVICFIPENNYRKKDVLNPASLAAASAAFVLGVLCLSAESVFVYFGF